MTTKKGIKKKTEAQCEPLWQLPATPTRTLSATPFTSFEGILTHDAGCKCRQKTVDYIGKTMGELGFVYMDCPFDTEHNVFMPKGLDSTNDQDRIAALNAYDSFVSKLAKAGLSRNANGAHSCIHEYLDHGLDGKFLFHPEFEEFPFNLATKKELKTYLDAKGNEAQQIAKSLIPTLPKNSFVTLLTDDDDIKGGVTGYAIIRDGIVHADLAKKPKSTPEKFLEYLLFRGLFLNEHSQQLLVVKTADNVQYYHFHDNKLAEVDFAAGKKQAEHLVKYRGKSLADRPFSTLKKPEAMFVIALLEKNDVLKADTPKAA